MPIHIDEFESDAVTTERSVPERVVGFLATNREHAFSRSEIAAAVDADPNTVSTALSRLASRGLVRHRGEYWALTDDLDRVRAVYDLHAASVALDEEDGGVDADAWDAAAPDEPHPSERADQGADRE